jgi:hypothetical protein
MLLSLEIVFPSSRTAPPAILQVFDPQNASRVKFVTKEGERRHFAKALQHSFAEPEIGVVIAGRQGCAGKVRPRVLCRNEKTPEDLSKVQQTLCSTELKGCPSSLLKTYRWLCV